MTICIHFNYLGPHGVELLDHLVTMVTLLRTHQTALVTASFYYPRPQQGMRVPLFSHLSQCLLLSVFGYSHTGGCGVGSPGGFDWHFPNGF